MTDEHQHEHEHNQTQRTLSVSKWVLIGFLIITGYFLFTEHRAHMFAYLPFIFLLACPLMHIFMHGGHGGHGGHDHGSQGNRDKDDKQGDA
ncbi:DUF2933 domain-containing protein [Undibacterium sp.]|uniref:DUF2933 domain-containing protein n=1 Tax=Undibacterium sp. TaxID=1914977 RepID=UPI0025EE2539|nr:DUF2933 domain-containing protein [Undibacterium sp.]